MILKLNIFTTSGPQTSITLGNKKHLFVKTLNDKQFLYSKIIFFNKKSEAVAVINVTLLYSSSHVFVGHRIFHNKSQHFGSI